MGARLPTGARRWLSREGDPLPYFGSCIVVVLGAAGWIVLSHVESPVLLALLVPAMIYAIFALSVGFAIKQNGWVSFGHAVFFGLPAYATAIAFIKGGLSPELAVIGAVLAAAALAFLMALVIGRVSGIALGMLTLAVGQGFYELAMRMRAVGGSDGLNVNGPDSLFGLSGSVFLNRATMFAVAWATLLVITLGVEIFIRSPYGRLTEAIRDNEDRERFLGYRTLPHRAVVFGISGLIAAVGGVLSTLSNGFVSPDLLHWSSSGTALIMALLGGVTRAWGPILGAVAYIVLRDYLGDMTEHWLAVVGAALIVVVVTFPAGLSGLLLRLFVRGPRRRAPALAAKEREG